MSAVSTGTLINGTTIGAGKFGSGLIFDGVNDIVGISVAHPEAFTKAAWIKPTNMAHCAANRCTVFSQYLEIINNNVLTFYSNQVSPVARTSTPSNTIVENERQHVAVTFDGYAIRLFHN